MAEPTEGIVAATGSRRGAFSPQNAREGRAQGDTSGKHTGMRKRAGTTILKADGATIEADGGNNRKEWGDNIESGWGQQQKRMGTATTIAEHTKNRKTVPDVTALRFTGMT